MEGKKWEDEGQRLGALVHLQTYYSDKRNVSGFKCGRSKPPLQGTERLLVLMKQLLGVNQMLRDRAEPPKSNIRVTPLGKGRWFPWNLQNCPTCWFEFGGTHCCVLKPHFLSGL